MKQRAQKQTELSSSPPTSNTEIEGKNVQIESTISITDPFLFLPCYQMSKKEKDKQSGTPDQETGRIFLSLVATAFLFILTGPPVVYFSTIIRQSIDASAKHENAADSSNIYTTNLCFTALLLIPSFTSFIATFFYISASNIQNVFSDGKERYKFENVARKANLFFTTVAGFSALLHTANSIFGAIANQDDETYTSLYGTSAYIASMTVFISLAPACYYATKAVTSNVCRLFCGGKKDSLLDSSNQTNYNSMSNSNG